MAAVVASRLLPSGTCQSTSEPWLVGKCVCGCVSVSQRAREWARITGLCLNGRSQQILMSPPSSGPGVRHSFRNVHHLHHYHGRQQGADRKLNAAAWSLSTENPLPALRQSKVHFCLHHNLYTCLQETTPSLVAAFMTIQPVSTFAFSIIFLYVRTPEWSCRVALALLRCWLMFGNFEIVCGLDNWGDVCSAQVMWWW